MFTKHNKNTNNKILLCKLIFCMHKCDLELPEYLLSLIHNFVHAEFGQQSWTFVLDLLHDSSAVQ